MGIEEALPVRERERLREKLLAKNDRFVIGVPKVELHVHLEGTLTAELRWKLSRRNGTVLRIARHGPELKTLEETKIAMDLLRPDPTRVNNEEERFQFFEAYYEGFECVKTREDFYDLAMHYLEHAAEMNVRYCELFFDPQGHTSRGTSWQTMMDGFRKAKQKAEKQLDVSCAFIMCFLRDLSPESAMEHYRAALPYRDIVVGIGLDSNEEDRPPQLFDEVFSLARQDGFKITMHCDVDSKNTHEHIMQAATTVAGFGLDRIDHGLNAAEKQDLIQLIADRGIGMTICPWSYLRHTTFAKLGPKIRILYDAGIPISINSDDPAYMEDCWILENILLVKHICNFDDKEVANLLRNAIRSAFASSATKDRVLQEIDTFQDTFDAQMTASGE